MITTLLLLASLALAQDSFDTHGFDPVGDNPTMTEVWDATKTEEGAVQAGVLVDYASNTLEVHTKDQSSVSVTPYVNELFAANFIGSYSLSDRVGLGASVPVHLGLDGTPDSSLGVGDSRLYSSFLLVDDDIKVTLVPFLGVPGNTTRFVTDSVTTGGGLLAATWTNDVWTTTANLGVHLKPSIEFTSLRGGNRGLMSVAVGKDLNDVAHLRGEVVADPTLRKTTVSDPSLTEFPAEVNLALRLGNEHGLSGVVGGSRALTRGVSAANHRVFAGVQWTWPAKAKPPCVTPVEPQFVDNVIHLEPIFFDFDKATIRFPESSEVLAELVTTLEDNPDITLLEIAGHTDSRGSAEYNQDLSQRRMQAVADFLVKEGISEDRLRPVGHGESQLLFEDCSDEGCHQKNRRVEFLILERD